MITLLIIACIFSQLQDIEPYKKWEIEIVTKKTDEYILLTKDQPVAFTVEGPTYLRIYTRMLWPEGKQGSQIYKVILQENEIDEHIITLESEQSTVSKDQQGKPVSKWRSFYIDVPEGMNHYKVIHWSSPKDTILLKFSYESPKRWIEIPATDYTTVIETIEEEKILKYYMLATNEEVLLRMNGPAKLRVILRLNYDEKLMGDQQYTFIVDDNGDVEKHSLKCYKSQIITYKDRQDIVPSNARSIYINLNEDWHTLKFSFSGTTAQSVSLRFLTEEK